MAVKRRMRLVLGCLMGIFLLLSISGPVYADNLDEIEKYVITAEVNEDATVNLNYHIQWRVLDSTSEGPLEWVQIGLPNSATEEILGYSDNIESLDVDTWDASYAFVYFDRPYEEGEVVDFEFTIRQNNMYQINRDEEGFTTYSFTPGWFDSLVVDELQIRWKSDQISSWSPDCLVKKKNHVWTTSLEEGETFTITVTYPNDAFAFSQEVSDRFGEDVYYEDDWDEDWGDDWNGEWNDNYHKNNSFYLPLWVILCLVLVPIYAKISDNRYDEGAFFGEKTETKITRTRVVYYTNCPNCAAPREEGKESCSYCGTSMIQSEDIIKEETLTKEEKENLSRYDKDGEYAYTPSATTLTPVANTFIRVHTVHVPVSIPSSPRSGGHGFGPRGGRGGGCAHSSCACASCACACACACAGGGRAGCSNKDFYSKSLKLRQLKKRSK